MHRACEFSMARWQPRTPLPAKKGMGYEGGAAIVDVGEGGGEEMLPGDRKAIAKGSSRGADKVHGQLVG
jgi:hypothetical protein